MSCEAYALWVVLNADVHRFCEGLLPPKLCETFRKLRNVSLTGRSIVYFPT